jgi:hypothetical protein
MDLVDFDIIWAIINLLLLITVVIVIVNLIRWPFQYKEITRRIEAIEQKLNKMTAKSNREKE